MYSYSARVYTCTCTCTCIPFVYLRAPVHVYMYLPVYMIYKCTCIHVCTCACTCVDYVHVFRHNYSVRLCIRNHQNQLPSVTSGARVEICVCDVDPLIGLCLFEGVPMNNTRWFQVSFTPLLMLRLGNCFYIILLTRLGDMRTPTCVFQLYLHSYLLPIDIVTSWLRPTCFVYIV